MLPGELWRFVGGRTRSQRALWKDWLHDPTDGCPYVLLRRGVGKGLVTR